MSVQSLCQTELPGTRPLYADLLCNFPGVSRFYARPPSMRAAQEAASDIRLDATHRQRLVDELRRQNADGDAAMEASLDLLSRSGTVVVATGQQVGLLGGPAFTLYKALTAVQCARELMRRGTPAVPVFWLATEDHDLEEVSHAWILGPSSPPRRLDAATDGDEDAAVGEVRVRDAKLDDLAETLRGLPHADEAVRLARDAYACSPTFGEAFRSFYRPLFSGTGLLFLCPMSEGIRTLAAPLVRQAIRRAPELSDALLRRGGGLQAAGYHQQVHFRGSTSLVLLFESAARVALKRRNGAYWSTSRAYSREDLLAMLEHSPLAISPNALLRPVMQDYLLPTAALVAGPSEAAYLAQSSVLYDELLGRMPAVLPRASFTVLDGASRKLLGKYGMSLADCLVPRSEIEARIASAIVPPPLKDSLAARRGEIRRLLGEMETALGEFDPTLADSFTVSRRKIEYQLDKIESKVSREAYRRAGTARRHASTLADFVYPAGHLQERFYSVPLMLAKFGLDFVGRVSGAIEPGSPDHKVLCG